MKKESYSLSDVVGAFTPEKRQIDAGHLWSVWVIRPLSFPTSWLFIKLGITANQITLASIFVGLIGCALFGVGNYELSISGGILLNVFVLLDCCDGNVARASKETSFRGVFLDRMASPIVLAFFFPCVGLGAYLADDDVLLVAAEGWFPGFQHGEYLVFLPFLGGIVAALAILRRFMDIAFAGVLKSQIEKVGQGREARADGSRYTYSLAEHVYFLEKNLFPPGGFLFPFVVLAAAFKLLSVYLVLYTVLHILDFPVILARRVVKLGK